MSEPSGRQEIIDEATLMLRLESLGTREALLDVLLPTGSPGEYLPTRKAWAERKPQEIGADIKALLDSNNVAVRIAALNDAGLPRRQETVGRFMGFVGTSRVRSTHSMQAAEVTAVTEIEMGKRRMLPILKLVELGDPSDYDQEFALSVPDLAYYVRTGQAAVRLG